MTNMFLSFFEISISISLIVIILILLTPFLNKWYTSTWKYWVWIFLTFRLLIPFSGINTKSAAETLLQKKTSVRLQEEKNDINHLPDQVVRSKRILVEIPTQATAPILIGSSKNNFRITLLDLTTTVWMFGSLAFLTVHLISYLHYKKQVIKKGTIIKDFDILNQILKLKQELHIKSTIYAVIFPEAASPMIIGFLKPILVLPQEQYHPEQLFFILKHELVHVKRKDVFIKLLFVAANAIHWFNPFIWIMQKEAAVDMELSCDERVTQGTDYTARKAYAETLMITLHKQCAKRNILLTRFYGEKQIMKKRFKNILIKTGKKYGISILICVIILTINLGTQIGCSIAKENIEDRSNLPENKNILSIDTSFTSAIFVPKEEENKQEANNRILTFSKEGITEQKQGVLITGNGYSICLPDQEWQQSDSDRWTAIINEQVQLWVIHFESESIHSIEEELTENGYGELENYGMTKQQREFTYKVRLKVFENEIWGVFYCYPTEAEEGWGRELPVIADTFKI